MSADIILGFAFGCLATVVAFVLEGRRQERLEPDRLAPKDERRLRNALHAWVEAYTRAKPKKGSKSFKRREANLFEACADVGTMWIPMKDPKRP